MIVAVVATAAWLIHLSAPIDQLDDDQIKPWGYVADIVYHGRWLAQVDYEGAQMSKPPLYQWLCALLAHLGLGVSPMAMYIPTGLAMIGTSLLICRAGSDWFGRRVGLGAGLAFATVPLTVKHMCMARTDALFCFTITLGALGAWHAWESNPAARSVRSSIASWFTFGLGATLACLTKGPLGILLAALGLGAAIWERRRGGLSAWGLLAAGIALAVTGLWFLAAAASAGQPLIDRMIGRELIGHAVGREAESSVPFSRAYQPFFYLATRMAPWGLLALIAVIGVLRRPAAEERTRRAERFCVSWLMLGMIMFAASTHQRADLLLPLTPAAALLAARLVERWLETLAARRPAWTRVRAGVWPAVVVIGLVQAFIWHHYGRLKDAQVKDTLALLQSRREVDAAMDAEPGRLAFLESGAEAQWAFGVMVPAATAAQVTSFAADPQPTYLVERVPLMGPWQVSLGTVVSDVPASGGTTWRVTRVRMDVGRP